MNEFHADLHCHTTCSDGSSSPIEIIKLAIQHNLKGLSITDHDTIDAYEEAIPFAKECALPLVSGAEFSAAHKGASVHLLAYSFSLKSEILRNFCLRHQQRRVERNKIIIKNLATAGMPLSQEEINKLTLDCHSSIGRPHIAAAMVKRGYAESIQDAFNRYIGEGKRCFAEGQTFSVEETLDIIHKANGLAIIAHPHLIDNSKVLIDLLGMDFDGLEGYYARFNPQSNERWLKIAKRKNWIITGGSDYHGDIKPNLPLGSSWVGEETFAVLHKHFEENSEFP
jgi:3',5'-nucleoside bisphosphate phosphatase